MAYISPRVVTQDTSPPYGLVTWTRTFALVTTTEPPPPTTGQLWPRGNGTQ